MDDGSLIVEKLIVYAKKFLYLRSTDVIYVRNLLLHILSVNSGAYEGDFDFSYISSLTVPDAIISEIADYAESSGSVAPEWRESFISLIMGIVSPRPGEVVSVFKTLREQLGVQKACEYLYNLSIMNNYIPKTNILKNRKWEFIDKNNTLEITINLSKPEKDNKKIAQLAKQQSTSYPKCMLCKENEGNYGTLTHPARVNLRTIPIKLADEDWFIQYSPYQYYEEHIIAINNAHVPMVINELTLRKLLDFVDYFPTYFVGSNADLPIVGGSFLAHEHYQGGKHIMPMHKARALKSYKNSDYPDVEISMLDWYNSSIRLESTSRDQLIKLGGFIIENWKNYDDETNEILHASGDTRHSTVTPIARMDGTKYCLELILRNNRTSEQYPDGIFHAHPEYHNIKKEGIGLIEAMGLFILPGRLLRQTEAICDILTGVTPYDELAISAEDSDLRLHANMICELRKSAGGTIERDKANKLVTAYINDACSKILECTAVFKRNDLGRASFNKFLSTMNIK